MSYGFVQHKINPIMPVNPVTKILACWALPDGDFTSNWRTYFEANMSPEDAGNPEKMMALSGRADIKGPFFPIGEQRYTKDFYKFLRMHYATEEDKQAYDAARRASTIQCDCCYHRTINQAFEAMYSLCQLCGRITPHCYFCVARSNYPHLMKFYPRCPKCNSA